MNMELIASSWPACLLARLPVDCLCACRTRSSTKWDKLPVVSRVLSCSLTPFIRLTTPVTHVPVVPHEAVAEVSRIGNV